MSNPNRDPVIVKIENAWIERARVQEYKPKTRAYQRAELEFFIGAMTALNSAFPADDPNNLSPKVPPYWIIAMMSGRPVVEG